MSISLTYFIDDKLGGVSSLNLNLIKNAPKDIRQKVIHLKDTSLSFAFSGINYPVNEQVQLVFDRNYNVYNVMAKMRKLVPNNEGALILNYGGEMSMLDHYQVKQTTYQLVHDDYNLKLAEKYGHTVDVFICHNKFIESKLQKLFPRRKGDVFFLPHGVSIPENYRIPNDNSMTPLKLLFLGRMTKNKGIYDLPVIAGILRDNKIDVEWTCIGAGPEFEDFKNLWSSDDKVSFLSPQSYNEVIEICVSHDLFVLPTKFEGTPVSLLETMSAGLVPVITSLSGGIEEIVNENIGYALPIDDNMSFAKAIIELHYDRSRLNMLSINCRRKIISDFNIEETAKKYFDLFLNYKLYKKNKIQKRLKIGSRLDNPFIPNFLIRVIRLLINNQDQST